jgi:HEAT repeat protein
MRKRVHITLAVLLVALAGVITWQVLRLREPVFQGKRLSVWLNAYRMSGMAGVETWQVRVEQQEADEAVRHIGTNALPTLLRMLRAKDSALKLKFMELAKRQHFIRIKYTPAEELNYRACAAFGVLRTKAQSAVPALIRIYEQDLSPASQFYVSRALIAVGPDATRTAIPAFLRGTASSNFFVRKFAVRALAQVHDEPSLVVPALAKSLRDTNVSIRASAASGLGVFGSEVRQAIPLAVPVLIKALRDPDDSVRGTAAGSLKAFGAEAKGAVPALLELLKDEDEYARGAAAEALGQIDPEAAARAGVK